MLTVDDRRALLAMEFTTTLDRFIDVEKVDSATYARLVEHLVASAVEVLGP